MPTAIILAGPNGAGKTTFANEWLAARSGRFVFVNADEIARKLAGPGTVGAALDLAAGRAMLAELDRLAGSGRDFMLETTLATLTHADRIDRWRAQGYRVELIYLRLASVEASLARVQRRIATGGHAIREADIRRRFDRSLDYLERIYKPIVDDWQVWASGDGALRMLDWKDR